MHSFVDDSLSFFRPGQSQLIISTMLWRASGLSSIEEYLESSLGMRQNLFPTVLGLKLAEDLDLGKRFKPGIILWKFLGVVMVLVLSYISYAPAAQEATSVDLKKAIEILRLV